MRILITGATGFLGSHIADALVADGHELMVLKRTKSNLRNCLFFQEIANWENIDDDGWTERCIRWKPEVVIHSAWAGVDSVNRDDWNLQFSNIDFLTKLLHVATFSGCKKFIGLGSQAEYGFIDTCIDENYEVNPIQKYGIVKVAALEQVKTFCVLNHIDWYWIRIFATFGERESEKWLMPSLINCIMSGHEYMDFTLCEQKYAYLYVKDLAKAFLLIIKANGKSGVYNLSSRRALPLRYIITYIRDHMNPKFKLNFGILPYRKGQAMLIQASVDKFVSAFGEYETILFESAIDDIINKYKQEEK